MKKELLESLILKGINTHESSNLPRSFSPSMLGSTLLQNFLTKVFGYQPDDSIGHNTLGSLMHYSLQHLVASDNILNEMKYKYEMKNGVTLSFIVDMMTLDKDGFITSIHDYKLTKIYAGKQLKKEKKELERELRRKEKALAEVAALLTLKKKRMLSGGKERTNDSREQ